VASRACFRSLIELRRKVTFYCYYHKPSQSSASPKPPSTIMLLGTAYISSGCSVGDRPRTGVYTFCGSSQHFVWLCPTCPQFPHVYCRRGSCPPPTSLAIGGLPGFVRLLLGARQICSGSSSGCKFEISTGGMFWVYALR